MADWSRFPRLTGDAPKAVLAGDSVLDNFYWLQDRRRNLRVAVEERLTGGMICLNMAVDQMSSFDFIYRAAKDNGWWQYQYAREATHKHCPEDDSLDRDGYKHLLNAKGDIESVENIARLKNVKYIFLSVGGNDVYLHADIQIGLGKSLLPLCDERHKIAAAYGDRLEKIVTTLKARIPSAEIVPVIVYHPHHDFPISGLPRSSCSGSVAARIQKNYLGWMVTPMVQQVLRIADQEKLSIIDLSQTFDPTNERHYGNMDVAAPMWSGAEPSDVSQEFIAELMVNHMQKPPAVPTIYHGVTSGDAMTEIKARPITPNVVETYRFLLGPKPEKDGEASSSSCLRKKKSG